jgi:hypothetical protein
MKHGIFLLLADRLVLLLDEMPGELITNLPERTARIRFWASIASFRFPGSTREPCAFNIQQNSLASSK